MERSQLVQIRQIKASQLSEQLTLLRSRTMIFRCDSAFQGSLRLHFDSMADRFEETKVLASP